MGFRCQQSGQIQKNCDLMTEGEIENRNIEEEETGESVGSRKIGEGIPKDREKGRSDVWYKRAIKRPETNSNI